MLGISVSQLRSEMMAMLQTAGSSPDMSTGPGGVGGAIIPGPSPYLVAKITKRQNDDEDSKLPCYGFTLMSQRDPFANPPNDGTEIIIEESPTAYKGDFSSIDPSLQGSLSQDFPFLDPAYELSGNRDVPIDGTAIVILWRSNAGRYYFFSWPGSSDIIPATLTRRRKSLSDPTNIWEYAWTKDSYEDPELQVQGTDEYGTLPVDIQSSHTQTQCFNSPDIFTITMTGATGGSFKLTDDIAGTTSDINFDATESGINGALSALSAYFTVVKTTTGTGTQAVTTYVFTSNDPGVDHSISLATSGTDPLTPNKPHYPAVFRNNIAMDVPVAVHLKKAGGFPSSVVAGVQTQGSLNGNVSAVLTLYIDKARDGTFTIQLVDSDTPQTLSYSCTGSDIVAAILALGYNVTVTGGGSKANPFIITFVSTTAPASDYSQHELIIDKSKTIGTTWYVVVWSNGNDCTAAIGGRYPPEMLGYTAAPVADVTIDPTSPSVGPWTLKVNNATGGSYDLVVDSGMPINTVFGGCPTISGFTVSVNGDGSCNLVGDGSSHSIQVYGCKLRSTAPVQFPGVISTNCVKLFPASDACTT